MRWLWVLSIAARFLAATILVAGPFTDDPDELSGWDSERFQEIADTPGTPYVDHEVEYPPGSVLIIETLAADDVVDTNRRLVVASLAVDLGLALLLTRRWRPAAGLTYLLVGTILVPMGLLRLDLWAALAATAAAAALLTDRSDEPGHRSSRGDVWFAFFVVIGAVIKLWPALLIAGAIAIGRWRAAALAAALGLVAGVAWIAVSGTDAVSQVASLRGATGWHGESLPGTLVALFTDEAARKEADAYRIGTLEPWVVTLGRLATMVTVVALVVRARVCDRPASERVAIVMVGALAGLLVTAPLLSPQFLLWLTPWVALLAIDRDRRLLGLTVAAVALTAGTLSVFGPPDLDRTVPAALLLLRNGLLVAIVVAAWQSLPAPQP